MGHKVKVTVTLDRHTEAKARGICERWDMPFSALVDLALEAAVHDVEFFESGGASLPVDGSFVKAFWAVRGRFEAYVRDREGKG